MRAVVACCVLAMGLGVPCPAQRPAPPTSAPAGAGMTVEDVIKLVKAGLSEDIIVQQIRKSPRAFDLSTDQLIQLKTASVSDRIIQVMLDPSRPDTASAPNGSEPAATAMPSPAPLPPPAKPERPPIGGAAMPTEIGVYAQKAGQWLEVMPEIVYWKTGGVVKTVVTAGIVHGNLNGHIVGSKSPNSFATPVEFLLVAPEGVAITEFQLVRMRVNKDNREFRTVTGGVFHSQSGAVRDLIHFEGTKVAARVFCVTFPSSLGPGEYGFLPPGAAGSSGKIYSFHVIE